MWRKAIRQMLPSVPQWATVALEPQERVVTAELCWDGGRVDATDDHTIASLKPLTVATSVDAGARPLLRYSDADTGRTLGTLRLTQAGSIVMGDASINLYEVAGGGHQCLPRPLREWTAWRQNRNMLRHRATNHLNMAPAAAQQLMVSYLCPRPVVLVSVDTETHRNIFPMDLIGPLAHAGLFTLALRSSNVSEGVMRDVGRVALSHPPASMKAEVYGLARHHKDALARWEDLSLPVVPSGEFGIPALASALRVQELTIVHSVVVGSHTFFVARVASSELRHAGAQLHHTAGFHQYERTRRGMPFPEV
jgi:flavin reductase (DIM6/NTAB) family NADH-FMN oxidoreductase RutF